MVPIPVGGDGVKGLKVGSGIRRIKKVRGPGPPNPTPGYGRRIRRMARPERTPFGAGGTGDRPGAPPD